MRSVVACVFIAIACLVHSSPEADLPRKGTLGVGAGAIDKATQDKLHLKVNEAQIVTRVVADSCAAKAGVQVGDVILQVNREKVGGNNPLAATVPRFSAGQTLAIKFIRNGKTQTISCVLAERPKQKVEGQEVEYLSVKSLGKRIRVITTHPQGSGPFPTVFLIGGIGAYSVDGNFDNIAYGNVLGPISRAGYATVRIDKPGQGDSEGPSYPDLRFGVEADAYVQALRFAKTLPYIDRNRIAIFGHSMGGVFGPVVASQEPVAGVAVGGTIFKSWNEYMLENTRRQFALMGVTPENLDNQVRATSAICNYLFYEKLSPKEIAKRHPELATAVKGLSPDGKTYSGVGLPFFQEIASLNIPATWAAVNAKLLVYWGENDFISTREDHEMLVEMFNKRLPGSATLKVLPNSDHGFQTTSSMLDSQQKWGRGAPHNPNIEQAIIDWLDRIIKPIATATN